MEFSLHLVKEGTRGYDWEVNLTLKVESSESPIMLADFAGGIAKLEDGYTTKTTLFSLASSNPDNRRLDFIIDATPVATLNPGKGKTGTPNTFNQTNIQNAY